ncbi:MAG: mannose-1-phosphate guanylyltransferase [Candidatus Dormibacteria bacterium]
MGLHILVLAGGGGTRLWPLSRKATPKHLLPLGPGGKTLLRASVERVFDLGDTVSVVTAATQAEGCAQVLHGLVGSDGIIAEPDARGTGPALGLATALLRRRDPDALIASLHADAEVGDDAAYRAAVAASAGWALATNGLATVGLRPTWPSSGMGYIEVGAKLEDADWRPLRQLPGPVAAAAAALPAFRAIRMVEKPGAADAAAYHQAGTHLWNLGLFAWPAATFLDELERADPSVAAAVDRTAAARLAGDEPAAAEAYSSVKPAAVEPLVLETTSRLSVVEAAFPWSDLGSWGDLHAARVAAGEADAEDNVLAGDALAIGARGCTIEARGGRLVVVAGADGLVVVDTPDALLVVPQSEAQRVKEVVERLRQAGRTELL